MTKHELYDFLEENDVKFVRLGFCDLFGNLYNYSVIANELFRIFEEGQPIDLSPLSGFAQPNTQDVWLRPDINTLSLLPWRPHTNAVLRFYCDIQDAQGAPFAYDARQNLKQAVKKLHSLGFSCEISTQCEFYLFKTNENDEPTLTPLDQGGYLDVSPLDKGENIRREICLYLEEMGLNPECSYHEQGPGQNEINFMPSDPLTAADHFITFKSLVKSIATNNGLFASFMPKPFLQKPGSALQLNMNLMKNGINLLSDITSPLFRYAQSFMAGILAKIEEITLFLNPLDNSYERLGAFDAPKVVGWSTDNQGQLLKVSMHRGDKSCVELRSADPTVNPYLVFALLLEAGIYGIENNLTMPKDMHEKSPALPASMQEAIQKARNSDFVRTYVHENVLASYAKRAKVDGTLSVAEREKYYQETYFGML